MVLTVLFQIGRRDMSLFSLEPAYDQCWLSRSAFLCYNHSPSSRAGESKCKEQESASLAEVGFITWKG
jgi:hypothetical protein